MSKLLYTLPDLHFGGTSNLLAQNISQLAKNHSVYVVFFGPTTTMLKTFEIKGVTPIRIPYNGYRDFFTAAKSLRRFMKINGIEVVNANLILDKFLVAASTINLNILKIATIHSADTLQANKSFKNKIIFKAENFLHNYVFNKTIVVSEAGKNAAVRFRKIKLRKISVVLNGIQPLKKITSNRIELYPSEDIIIGTACRFHDIKGLPRLVKFFHELKKHLPVKLLLIGDGGKRKDIERLIEDLKLTNNVEITGFQNDVTPYINHLHYYVNSSFSEAMPVSVLEALSIGKPIIASDVGGLREIVKDNFNGILIDFDDEKGSVKKVLEFLKNHNGCYKILSDNAHKSFNDKFSSEIYCRNLEKVYNFP